MADTVNLEQAFARFESALRQFEAAVARSQEREIRSKALAGEADALRHDRMRLAGELDQVRNKASDLVDSNRKAVSKIDAAMSRIRAVLHSNSGGG